jgi:predicted MFS family arabinose efflux permease
MTTGARWTLPAYLTGQGISLLGDSAYYVALGWAAAQAGGATGVALVSSIAGIPRALLMLPGGAIADRLGPRRTMLGSDAARMAVITLAALLTMGGVHLTVLAGTALLFGIADALFIPASAALPPRLVPRDGLQRANGLITFMRRVALLAGAPLGGLLVAGPGTATAFWFEAATFGVSLTLLALVRLRPLPPGTSVKQRLTLRSSLSDGPRVIWRSPMLRGLVIVSALTELGFSGPFNAGLPLLAQARGWGAGGMGLLLTAFGSGAALGALTAVPVRRRIQAGHLIVLAVGAQAGFLAGLALIGPLGWALAVSFAIGVVGSLSGTTLSTLIQVRAEPAELARVMSVVNLSSFGAVPIGNALTGLVSAVASVPGAYLVGAALEGVAALTGLAGRRVRTAAFPAARPVPADPAPAGPSSRSAVETPRAS